MGLMHLVAKSAGKLGDGIAKTAALSPKQLEDMANKRDAYLLEMPNPKDTTAIAVTEKLLAANSIEVFHAYLPQLSKLYAPLEKDTFDCEYNIRYFNITKWVTDKRENSLEKLVNVYAVLSDETCNIALIFHRMHALTQVYLAVTNTANAKTNSDADAYVKRLQDALKGNFPGTEFDAAGGVGTPPFLENETAYSVASVSNIPTEKSEKFVSQTIEKLLDGIVPSNTKEEYTLILLASPIGDVEERKLRLSEIYSGLKPYAAWQTNYTFTEMHTEGSSATVSVNVGASAGIQNGQNSSTTDSDSTADQSSTTDTDSENNGTAENTSQTESNTNTNTESDTINHGESDTNSEQQSHTDSTNSSQTESYSENKGESINAGVNASVTAGGNATVGIPDVLSIGGNASKTIGGYVGGGANWGTSTGTGTTTGTSTADSTASTISKTLTESTSKSLSESVAKTLANTVGKTTSSQVGHAIAQTLGRTVTNTLSKTAGVFSSTSLGVNFGMSFARSSNVSASMGKNEGITQSFENYNIRHALELLEEQMKRLEQSTALGMWDFAAYILSEDRNIANNVAHTYLSLTQGENSYMSNSAINFWRGDTESKNTYAKTICSYLRELRHPVFGLNPEIVLTEKGQEYQVYPAAVTAAASLSGKELAYSLNFPQKSIAGLPVIQCAEFGRSITTFDTIPEEPEQLDLGNIFHMLHEEKLPVKLSKNALTSHTFITGSTGSGKSNTVYQILQEAQENDVHFLVIEPAKGEYKHVFGNEDNVQVYGTNPHVTPLLKLNPFRFPKGIHVLEHLDGLVEIFNVCYPMYAAMPAVLKHAMEQSYEDCGWNLKESVNPYGEGLYPTFADVIRNIRTIIDSGEYDTENKGAYKGSLITRLESLTTGIYGLVFCEDELSDSKLFDSNVVCDLSRVRSSETKALMMGILVLKLQEYRMVSGKRNAALQHLTVMEEAHHLLKRTSTEQPVEGGNLLGKSVEMLSNAIAEMRTYGEGFILVDQSPGLLDLSAIRNTNTKILMRLPDESDRILVGKAANLDEEQIRELARLPRGVAAVYQNEWVQPVLCKIKAVQTSTDSYRFEPQKADTPTPNPTGRTEIAKLLCNGTPLDKTTIVSEIRPKLQNLALPASINVLVQTLLEKPSATPNIEQIGEVAKYLLPVSYAEAKRICTDSSNKKEWTKRIEAAVLQEMGVEVDSITRRYLIQGLITAYVYHELQDIKALQDWTERGELR